MINEEVYLLEYIYIKYLSCKGYKDNLQFFCYLVNGGFKVLFSGKRSSILVYPGKGGCCYISYTDTHSCVTVVRLLSKNVCDNDVWKLKDGYHL